MPTNHPHTSSFVFLTHVVPETISDPPEIRLLDMIEFIVDALESDVFLEAVADHLQTT